MTTELELDLLGVVFLLLLVTAVIWTVLDMVRSRRTQGPIDAD